MESMKALALLCLAALPALPAQQRRAPRPATQPPASAEPVIREIEIVGNKVYTAEQLIALSGLRPGMPVRRDVFEAANDRMMASGAIESFGWRYQPIQGGTGFKVTLEMIEVSQHYPWFIERFPAVSAVEFAARAAKELPLFAEKIPASETYMSQAAALLQKMLAERGVNERVVHRVTLLGKDTIAILFGPSAPPPAVAEVRFVGARAIHPNDLAKSMAAVAIGVPFIEPNFRMLLDNQIRPMYETAGRLRASFPKLEVAPSASVKGVVVTVHVDEGEPYILGKVEVNGLPIPTEEAGELGAWGIGKQVNFSDIGRGIEKIQERARENGYMKIAYKAQRRLNDEKKSVDIIVNFEPGPQYKFGHLKIQGLDIESEPVIRKMFAMKPGDPFRKSYGDMFLSEIRSRGVFDNLGETKTKLEVNDRLQTVDLTLIFSGEKREPAKKRP